MGTDFFATFLFSPFSSRQLYLPVSTGSSQGHTSAMIPKTQFNFFLPPTFFLNCHLPQFHTVYLSQQHNFMLSGSYFAYRTTVCLLTIGIQGMNKSQPHHGNQRLYELFWIHTVCTGSRSNKQLQGMQPIPASLILLRWLNLNSKFFSLHAVISSSLFGNRQKSSLLARGTQARGPSVYTQFSCRPASLYQIIR